jgi:RecA/RadA recombinase
MDFLKPGKKKKSKAAQDDSIPKHIRLKRFEPLFNPEESMDIRDNFISKIMTDVDKRRSSLVSGKDSVDPMVITETYMMNNNYIPTQVLETLPTDDIRFDLMCAMDLNGHRGIPRGKAMEISGPEEMMKSARAAAIVAAIQQDPRGAIVIWFETESKINQRYIAAAGADTARILLELPDYVEQVYYSAREHMLKYKKERDKFVKQYIAKHSGKTLTSEERELLIFRGRMSFPILVFVYDSIGNHQSMEAYKKDEAGKTTKTIGKHAMAHADGFRSITNLIGNTMSVFIGINHTKDDMGGMGGAWGIKRTTTYGGAALRYMNSIRIEQRGGIGGPGSGGGSFLERTSGGEKIKIGKWLTVKFLKNSLVDSSHQRIENVLFRYKSGIGFDIGVSYLLALEKAGMLKGGVSLGTRQKNKIISPDGRIIEAGYIEFGDMLRANPELKNMFRVALLTRANDNSTLIRQDI